MTDFDLCAYLGRDKKHLFQKCLPLESVKNPEKLKFPMWASEKFDGVFCAALRLPDGGGIGIFSRTGERYVSMKHLENDLKAIIDNEYFGANPIVLFEAYIPETDQATISGYCRDTKEQHPEIVALIHTTIGNFSHKMNLSLQNQAELGYLNSNIISPDIKLILHIKIFSLTEAMRLAQDVWQRGGEGIILNAIDVPYQPGKRNTSMIKIKKGISHDLRVIGVYAGQGKYAGTLGGLICRYKDNQEIRVSGMTDAERKAWWEDNQKIIGKIVQIDAMAESSKGKLREPRFKGIRYDKAEADFE